MTTGTPQSQAIQNANSYIGLAQQVMNIYAQIATFGGQWTDQGVAGTLGALGTVATNADGSPGAADPAPVFDHMIDLTLYPSLSRSMSSLQITQAKTVVDAIKAYIDGQALAANPGARAILNAATGG